MYINYNVDLVCLCRNSIDYNYCTWINLPACSEKHALMNN